MILNLGIHAHFTIHLKKISVCSKVFVLCKIFFGELEDTSYFQSGSLNPKALLTLKLKRVCIENNFPTL